MLQTLSQKAIWVNVIALSAAIGTAFGFDLGLDAASQAEIVAGILAIVNVILHAVQHKREKKAGGTGSGPGSINTSMLILPLLLLALFVGGCANVPAPKTPRQTIAYSESSYASVVQTLNGLHEQGVLTPGQEDRLDVYVQQGTADLKAAHAALDSGDTSTVQGKLAALDQILIQLRLMIAKETPNESR